MKDLRGSSVSAVRNAISRKYGLQFINRSRKNSVDFMNWKSSKEVADCHDDLFSNDDELKKLTTAVFSLSNDLSEDQFSGYYVYTASVSDIILNPKLTSSEVNRKPLESRLQKFKVFIDFFFYYFKKKTTN